MTGWQNADGRGLFGLVEFQGETPPQPKVAKRAESTGQRKVHARPWSAELNLFSLAQRTWT